MKFLFRLVLLCLLSSISYAQTVYQIRADSVRIYSGCDTAELIIENHTQDTLGFLFNKGKGRTEFRKVRMKMLGNSLAIVGQDTIQLGTLVRTAVDTLYKSNDTLYYRKMDGNIVGVKLNYVQAQGANPQAISFNISGSGRAQTIATGAPIGGQDLVLYKPSNLTSDTTVKRWVFYKSGAESGGNSGSNLVISRYDDNGVFLGNPLQIARVNGDVVFAATPKVGGVPLWIQSNHPAGNAMTASFSGANVLDTLITNQGGHVTSVKTRILKAGDIGAASASGGSGYIQNQYDSIQIANFNIDGVGRAVKGFVSNAGQNIQHYTLRVNNNTRWNLGLVNGESGQANAGSDFVLWRYNDAGSLIAPALSISRATGIADMPSGFIAASGSKIRGTGTGIANFSYLRFTESDGVTSAGYIGKGGSGSNDLVFLSDKGSVRLSANGSGNPQFEIRDSLAVLTNGMLVLSNGTSNNLVYAGFGVGAPTFNTRSAGTKITFYTSVNSTNADYAIGLESGHAWLSVPQKISTTGWKFYGGTTQVGRIDGNGGADWEGMSRFKGDYSSGTGPATEVGFSSGQAQLRGYDRTTNAYTTISLTGGSLSNPKTVSIDGTGYRLNMLPNAVALGTDANGYLVSKMPLLSDILGAGNQTGNNSITFNRTLSWSNQLMDLQQGYGLYSDNVNGIDNREGVRLWIDSPENGDIVLGPRTLIKFSRILRIKAKDIKLEGGDSKFFNYSALATDLNGYIVDGSANFIKNNTSAQTANFNISGTGVIGGNLTVGGNEIVTGSVTSTGFYQSSLRALKMNIKTCELNATRIIDSLKIREFEYKKDPGKKVVGIIADDEPSIVSGEKHDHLDMMNAVGLLLKSVQELNARVEKLEQQINKEHASK